MKTFRLIKTSFNLWFSNIQIFLIPFGFVRNGKDFLEMKSFITNALPRFMTILTVTKTWKFYAQGYWMLIFFNLSHFNIHQSVTQNLCNKFEVLRSIMHFYRHVFSFQYWLNSFTWRSFQKKLLLPLISPHNLSKMPQIVFQATTKKSI